MIFVQGLEPQRSYVLLRAIDRKRSSDWIMTFLETKHLNTSAISDPGNRREMTLNLGAGPDILAILKYPGRGASLPGTTFFKCRLPGVMKEQSVSKNLIEQMRRRKPVLPVFLHDVQPQLLVSQPGLLFRIIHCFHGIPEAGRVGVPQLGFRHPIRSTFAGRGMVGDAPWASL